MRVRSKCFWACVLALALLPTHLPAIERWSDDGLNLTKGLLVWLDAASLPAARQASAQTLLEPGDTLDVWPNAAQPKHNFVQADERSRPTYEVTGGFHSVRFENGRKHLRLSEPLTPQQAITVFVVAAAYSCPEPFSAFVSMGGSGQNDFQTGLNVDQGFGSQRDLEVLNVEGRGSQGMQNLLKKPLSFGTVARMSVTSIPGKDGVSLWVNGVMHGARDRDATGDIQLDEVVLGARHYTLGGPPEVRNFLHGEIAELLIYDRALSNEERMTVETYLTKKYGAIEALPLPETPEMTAPLVRVKDAPAVQVFVPGFTARELPVDLTNVNNIKYRQDGALIALGYDGRIWNLRDTDGDGVEDRAALFWENKGGIKAPIGMDLTPPGYNHGEGVFLVSKSQCLLIVDTDADGKADREIEVAGGWQESFHGVDGLGVAFDPRDGSVYYGRGTHNFTDPFLRDKVGGGSSYSLKKDSGVVFRVSPDFKTREIYATGIRFPVAIRLNQAGDLFCTDQEGATWLANGNPFDELLHVQQGRHFGFPPRHPRHLPDVIDEPSTFDYRPQHQSTCGFCFNEPVKRDGPTFGPADWKGDVFVTGYSRGKLYRTQLHKTRAGYVARNQLFACLNMLTVDCCIAPDGSLVVACHSGGPDWGSGPSGKGKLYKISYTGRDQAQPLFAWAASEREVRVEFDRPVNPETLRDVLNQAKIAAGESVRAGDRFESLWPGYAVVHAQQRAPRREVRVHSAQLTPDRRTLVLATDLLTAAQHYAVTLPNGAAEMNGSDGLSHHPQIDLDFDLSGVRATWVQGGREVWAGWLPTLDLDASRKWTRGSAHHDRLWGAMGERGELVLEAQLNLRDMLRPAVQPGSSLDYELPPERVMLAYESSVDVQVTTNAESLSQHGGGDRTIGEIRVGARSGEPLPVTFRLRKSAGESPVRFSISYSTHEDSRARPLQIHRALLPWAEVRNGPQKTLAPTIPEQLTGGSWARGRQVFLSDQAACAKCHTVHRQGGKIGPDLSNLIHRDYESVMRDIAHPNFAINPDFLASSLVLADGRALQGIVRSAGNELRITDHNAKTVVVPKAEVEELKPSSVSVMPEGIEKTLSSVQMRDLLTFLLTSAPSMPRDYQGGPRPKPRTVAEVNKILAGAPEPAEPTRPIEIVLVAGKKDHGPGEHDYPAWQKAWKELLAAAAKSSVTTAWEWPSDEQLKTADVLVFYQHGDWDAKRAADVDQFLRRGGGLVYIHWAIDGRKQGAEFAQRIGLAGRGVVAFRHGELTLSMNQRSMHPVIRNFGELALTDETYWKMAGDLKAERVLATAVEEKQPQPQVWSLEHGKGRVFVSIPGHYSWTFDDPLFRVLLLRGIAWAAHEPVDRFNDLVWPGADVAD